MFCNDIEVEIRTVLTSNNLALFVQKASRYDAEIFLKKGKFRANAKSFLGLLSLQITNNDKIILSAKGWDANEAIKDLEVYLKGRN